MHNESEEDRKKKQISALNLHTKILKNMKIFAAEHYI